MALIICPECKKEISDQSVNCIHCGYPIKEKNFLESLDSKKEDIDSLNKKYNNPTMHAEHAKIYENRFLVWLMWLGIIACTGPFAIIIWTVVQVCKAQTEVEQSDESAKKRAKVEEEKKKQAEENLQYQIDLAKKFGKGYYVIDGKVHMFDKPSKK